MQQRETPLSDSNLSPASTAQHSSAASSSLDDQKSDHLTHVIRFGRFKYLALTVSFLLVLYLGSYFATAFATGAGWMEISTRHRIVWTIHRPISNCAVDESFLGYKSINDANGYFFKLGWNWLHE